MGGRLVLVQSHCDFVEKKLRAGNTSRYACSDGVREGFAPVTLCDVSRISMILGPDGELDRTVAPCLDCRQIVLARAVSSPREL
jgi:hypothetical protein